MGGEWEFSSATGIPTAVGARMGQGLKGSDTRTGLGLALKPTDTR